MGMWVAVGRPAAGASSLTSWPDQARFTARRSTAGTTKSSGKVYDPKVVRRLLPYLLEHVQAGVCSRRDRRAIGFATTYYAQPLLIGLAIDDIDTRQWRAHSIVTSWLSCSASPSRAGSSSGPAAQTTGLDRAPASCAAAQRDVRPPADALAELLRQARSRPRDVARHQRRAAHAGPDDHRHADRARQHLRLVFVVVVLLLLGLAAGARHLRRRAAARLRMIDLAEMARDSVHPGPRRRSPSSTRRINENVSGVRVIQWLSREDENSKRFDRSTQ